MGQFEGLKSGMNKVETELALHMDKAPDGEDQFKSIMSVSSPATKPG